MCNHFLTLVNLLSIITHQPSSQHQVMPYHDGDISLRHQEWRTWTELKLKITGLPPQVGTLSVYELLCQYGEILRIDLLEDNRGHRTGTAFIVFAPPPQIAFWLNRQQFRFVDDGRIYTLTITAEDKTRSFVFRSPVENRLFRERMVCGTTRIRVLYTD